MSRRYMSLENALATIQERGVFLHFDAERGIDLWTPHTRVPITLRRAIVKHRDQLAAMMREGRWETCVNPSLHRKYSRCKQVCGVCARIECA